MGKKDKKKKAGKGAEKTALKTQKKLKNKLMKLTGEDAIENMVKAIEEEEKKRKSVKEVPVENGKPSSRSNFSIVAHPDNPEIILFGGEFYNGQTTTMFNELLVYSLKKKSWTMIQSPGAPPPRSSHQVVVSSQGGGQMWLFGGEYASPSESQFYHYRDLWLFHFGTKRWEKVVTDEGGPSPRSGARMVIVKKNLLIFGGFHDVLSGSTTYFNDVHLFDTADRKWKKMEVAGTPPSPRSAACVYALPDNRIVIYGGYCKEKIKGPKSKKSPEKGKILTDMFLLVPDKNDETMTKWKWQTVKQSGPKPTPPRSGMCLASVPNSNKAFLFGGVQDLEDDDDDDDEDASGQFFNELFSLQVDNDKASWQKVEYSGKSQGSEKKKRRAKKTEDVESSDEDEGSDDADDVSDGAKEALQSMDLKKDSGSTVVVEEGIFTVTSTVSKATSGPSSSSAAASASGPAASIVVPSARYGAGMVVKQGLLYLYGGVFEDRDDRQITFNDFYSIDIRKLDEWQVLIEPDLQAMEWIESESSESDSDDSDDDDEDDSEMDTD